jgi:TPR repeat protein
MYRQGECISQNYELAMAWFQKAASSGDIYVQYSIGCMYKNGLGVSQDYKLAMEWYQKAASDKYDFSQLYIGEMHENGLGVSQDYTLAMEWYQYNIGSLYENGYGTTKDIDIAIEWYKKAADNNNEEAKEALERLTKEQNDAKKLKGSIPSFVCSMLFSNNVYYSNRKRKH